MQFDEPATEMAKCPVCKKPVVKRTTRGRPNYCSRTCASQARFHTRYVGSLSGPLDKPSLKEKTKLPN